MNDSIPQSLADSINVGLAQRALGDRVQADYIVMAVAMLVWVGVFLYLMRLDRISKEIARS